VALQVRHQPVRGVHVPGDEVLDDKGALLQMVGFGEIVKISGEPERRLDVDEGRVRGRGRDGLLSQDDPLGGAAEHLNEAVVPAQVRGPVTELAAVHDVEKGLVERGEDVEHPAVALGDRTGVLRDGVRVGGVDELVVQPCRGAVVHEVDDRGDAELGEPLSHLVQPAPVEPSALRIHAVPGDAPTDHLGPALGDPAEVRVPEVVVLRHLVLVERAFAERGLRDEGVLDPDGWRRPPRCGAAAGKGQRPTSGRSWRCPR
jgi:hypothetical protein